MCETAASHPVSHTAPTDTTHPATTVSRDVQPDYRRGREGTAAVITAVATSTWTKSGKNRGIDNVVAVLG